MWPTTVAHFRESKKVLDAVTGMWLDNDMSNTAAATHELVEITYAEVQIGDKLIVTPKSRNSKRYAMCVTSLVGEPVIIGRLLRISDMVYLGSTIKDASFNRATIQKVVAR